MNGCGKSDGPVLPAKPTNKVAVATAEPVEGRGSTKGNTASKTRPGHRAGQDATSALDRVRQVAVRDKQARFTALLHHVDVDRLRDAYRAINPNAAPGVDTVTWAAYGQDLEDNLMRARAAACGALPGQADQAGVHPEDGRAATTARHRRVGGQDPSTGRRRGARA